MYIELNTKTLAPMVPPRPKSGHKRTFGQLLIWAGDDTMLGAACMCGEAALRSGMGLLHVAADKDQRPILLPLLRQAVFHIRGHATGNLIRSVDACVIGPGLKPGHARNRQMIKTLLMSDSKVVLDAGALDDLVAKKRSLLNLCKQRDVSWTPPILTPHPGEFLRMFPSWDVSDRSAFPARVAQTYKVVLVLKDAITHIYMPDGRYYRCKAPNSGMAKGGSGDVLAGLIGGFLAQTGKADAAACIGVYFHALAGAEAAKRFGTRYMQPTDVMMCLPEAYRQSGLDLDQDEGCDG